MWAGALLLVCCGSAAGLLQVCCWSAAGLLLQLVLLWLGLLLLWGSSTANSLLTHKKRSPTKTLPPSCFRDCHIADVPE
jgi:hypothetical protein